MKKFISAFSVLCVAVSSMFASITLPVTKITIQDVPEDGKWIVDDRTEFSKQKAMGIIDVPHPIINNAYLSDESKIGQPGEVFTLLNECSGMGFAFEWSAVRIMAIRETANEVEKFYSDHIARVGGRDLKISAKDRDKKTGEMYFRYTWRLPNGKLVNGYTHGIYYNKETLVNLTIEWTDKQGEAKARSSFEALKKDLNLKYDLKI